MISTMTRKKSEHKTERVAVQMPKPWADLARKLAAKNKQPTLWFLLALVAEEAKKHKEQCPPLPWEEDLDSDS